MQNSNEQVESLVEQATTTFTREGRLQLVRALLLKAGRDEINDIQHECLKALGEAE